MFDEKAQLRKIKDENNDLSDLLSPRKLSDEYNDYLYNYDAQDTYTIMNENNVIMYKDDNSVKAIDFTDDDYSEALIKLFDEGGFE